jgi:hypothetical protein
MRFTINDVNRLCDDFLERNLKGKCVGCRLSEELAKPVSKRSKPFLKRVESRTRKLRENAPVV